MNPIKKTIHEAVDQGIVDQAQGDKLVDLFQAKDLIPAAVNTDVGSAALMPELALPKDEPDFTVSEASETPRLVRGFHDVLISIGVVAALGGLWGIFGPIPVIIAAWVLAEIFVNRQHLALPAFVLTAVFVASIAVATIAIVDTQLAYSSQELSGAIVFFALLVFLWLFYWRFRIPVSLAAMIVGGVGLGLMVILAFLEAQTGVSSFESSQTGRTGAIGMLFGLVLFLIAMWFDSSDINRKTRRSDVAFWLHLCTAPALLYAIIATLFSNAAAFGARELELGQLITVIVIVGLMMLIGIVIDRRAFVTSGLLSLGLAIYTLAQQIDLQFSAMGAFAFLIVGLVVLTLGSSWQWMRRIIVGALPGSIQARIPPIVTATPIQA